MAYGKVTKLDPVFVKKPAMQRTTKNDCTDEELIDSGNIQLHRQIL